MELDFNEYLDFDEYQAKAYTAIQKHESHKEEVMHWAIGLGEEAGEVLSVIKHKYYSGEYSVAELAGELGDVLWHIAALCTVSGISMEDVALLNLAKLNHRYPNDKFDFARSAYRREHDIEFKDDEQYRTIVKRMEESWGNEHEKF